MKSRQPRYAEGARLSETICFEQQGLIVSVNAVFEKNTAFL